MPGHWDNGEWISAQEDGEPQKEGYADDWHIFWFVALIVAVVVLFAVCDVGSEDECPDPKATTSQPVGCR